MRKQKSVWQKVTILLILGIVLIVVPFTWPSHVNTGILTLFFLLGFGLIIEALSQPDPSEFQTPFYKLIGRYTNRRDRLVASLSFIVFILVLYLPTFLFSDMEINWVLKLALFVLFALLAFWLYFVVASHFGSHELRDNVTPRILKRYLEKLDKSKS